LRIGCSASHSYSLPLLTWYNPRTLTSSLANHCLQGDYWSFNLASSFLPIILLRNNVSDGRGSVSDTYKQYIIIYAPGIIGALLALVSVQMPLVGRKWSLVFSAICQGLSMAMYTQVDNTAGYVGLNALEYIMQTVCPFVHRFAVYKRHMLIPIVLQRRSIRICSRTLRYQLPRYRQRYAVLPRSDIGYRCAICGRELPRRQELGYSVVGGGRHLAFCAGHGVPACGDEEQTDVLSTCSTLSEKRP
jgi:hypothetical protein